MLAFLPAPVRGAIAFCLLALNTLFWCGLLLAFALVKLALPFSYCGIKEEILALAQLLHHRFT